MSGKAYQLVFNQLNGWKIETYQLYWDYFNSKECSSLKNLIHYCDTNDRSNFLWPLEIGTMQFLAAVFYEKKLIKIASKQLSRELSLIHCSENFPHHDMEELVHFANTIAEIPSQNSPTSIEFLAANLQLPLFNEPENEYLTESMNQLANQLVSHIASYRSSFFEKISDFSLDLIANFTLIRIHVLKFLAILPCLDHDRTGHEVKRIFIETLRRLKEDSILARKKKLKGQKRALPRAYETVCAAVLVVSELLPASLLSFCIRKSTEMMAKRFIAGKDIRDAYRSLQGLMASGREATIDQLGELVVSKKEADEYTDKVIEIIEGLSANIPKGQLNGAGINKAHVSIKVTALTHDFKPQSFEFCYHHVAPRLIKILKSAKANDVFVNIDAEHYHYRDTVFQIYSKVLLEVEELKDFKATGIVVQAYLKDCFSHLQEVIELAKQRNICMPIRLVKGAYWDAETIEASAHNFEAPQFVNKEETDIAFRQMLYKVLENGEHLQLAVASHNIKDHCFSEIVRSKCFPNAPAIEHQCLHMTYEGLSVAMAKMNWTVRNYIPVGNLLVGMAYLVRRIMENSSQVGVLTAMRSHKKSLDPKTPTILLKQKKEQMKLEQEDSIKFLTREFKNIYPIRTYLNRHRTFIDSILKTDLKKLENGELFADQPSATTPIYSSSNPDLLLGRISYSTPEQVDLTINKLFKEFKQGKWGQLIFERTLKLYHFADLMLIKREKLVSLIMLEAGKTIDEAVADVDEAIDFIHFYLREQISASLQDELAPQGVVGVIAPWNFPLAIPCGMCVAALVAGNTVVLKPAEQTNLVALAMMDLAREAGIPEEVFAIECGEGDVGAAIVAHELINGIVFTGSKAVGEHIFKQISIQNTSSKYEGVARAKFAITEMGGKNAIIVTNNCELDETISGIIYSAFAHGGQKCSAASRIIIDNKIKETFITRFEAAVADLNVGSSLDYAVLINPLISQQDKQRVQALAIKSEQEVKKYQGRTIINRSQEEHSNYCVAPSVFELPANIALKEQTVAKEEVFGPIVHIIGYKDLDHAIEIFNSTDYALTGGVYCQSQDDLDYLLPKLEAGNIYINRPSTGARVAIEPFGGFKMSGTGPKAGSKEYLKKFNQKKLASFASSPTFDVVESSKLQLAQFSKLSWERRKENVQRLLNTVIEQFEVLFGQITETNKSRIRTLLQMLDKDQIELNTLEFPNRPIEGQKSYSMRDMSYGNGVVVDANIDLQIGLVEDVLVNLLIGNGLNIVAVNEKIYQKWSLFTEWAYINGFSNFNLSLAKFSKKQLEEYLSHMNLDFCLFSHVDIDPTYKKAAINKDFKQHLIRLFYSQSDQNIMERVENFTHVRAFAVNTMRHGAPLDLNL